MVIAYAPPMTSFNAFAKNLAHVLGNSEYSACRVLPDAGWDNSPDGAVSDMDSQQLDRPHKSPMSRLRPLNSS